MNIFLDKSLPKRTQLVLQVVRIVLFVIIFGSIYYATINPSAGDVLLYASIALAGGFFGFKIIKQRRRNKSMAEEQLTTLPGVQVSDTTGDAKSDEAGNKK